MNDYNEFVILAEGEIAMNSKGCIENTAWETKKSINKIRKRANLYSKMEIIRTRVSTAQCKSLISNKDSCFAEVVFVKDNQVLGQVRNEFCIDKSESFEGEHCSSVVIRILEDKSKIVDELKRRSINDVIFFVNGKKCEGNRQYLASMSPVFLKLLYVRFAEAKENEIVLKDVESAEVFKDFLLAISPLRIQPNPTNVVGLLKLARQFDIPFLLRDCSNHLKYCYEVPIVDRITLAETYNLGGLQMHIANSLTDAEWQTIRKEHGGKLRELGPEFFISRLFTKGK
ncbi:BTB/POZ domain-containing protein [Ditylenchus destructor]|nr:BTB/POZ domain-containing protein [Ditylenchus destructor]